MSNEVEVYEQRTDLSMAREPKEVLAEAQKAAIALHEVITKKKKPVIFNGEQYLEFEDWATLGRFYGLTVKVVDTRPVQFGDVGGFEARAVVIHGPTGREVSAAEAMCLNDEANWKIKPLFQLKSMAQTRACAKAFRNVLAWVVVLAGYRPTPAEEMTGVEGKGESSKPVEPSNGSVVIKSVADRVGKGPYKITDANMTVYSTFDEKMADYAKKAASTGLPVILAYEKDKFGYKLVEIKSAQTTAPVSERESGEEG